MMPKMSEAFQDVDINGRSISSKTEVEKQIISCWHISSI
jgi:hypothetical protein